MWMNYRLCHGVVVVVVVVVVAMEPLIRQRQVYTQEYLVYLAEDASGTARSQVESAVPVGGLAQRPGSHRRGYIFL